MRALEAAGRQSEPRWALAMLREQGQRALDHTDRSGAEAAWSRMLGMVLAPEMGTAQRPRPTSPTTPAAASPKAKTSSKTSDSQKHKANDATPATSWRSPPARGRSNHGLDSHTTRPTLVRRASYRQTATKKRAAPIAANDQVPDPAAAEEAREQRGMERFLSLLEKNPRRSTALDRVYGYHVERGTLDTFIKSFQDRVDKNPNDGTGWLILGLLEGQRGQDAAAVKALQKAEATRTDDPLPPYYLGQALVLVGQPEQAAGAFERALARKPSRTDLLEIFQALGRVYERTQKADQALQVWNRLEALFPNDPRVGEQIASALADENQPAAAPAPLRTARHQSRRPLPPGPARHAGRRPEGPPRTHRRRPPRFRVDAG